VADSIVYNRIGFAWMPRYTIPLSVGIPTLVGVVAAMSIPASPRLRAPRVRLLGIVCVLVATAHVVTFAWVLHRYASGLHASWSPSAVRWQPPGTAVGLTALFVLWAVAAAWSLHRWMTSDGGPGAIDELEEP